MQTIRPERDMEEGGGGDGNSVIFSHDLEWGINLMLFTSLHQSGPFLSLLLFLWVEQ